ncbi:MAG: serine/threonine protein kinase [Acidobacteria bacterium]|nr:serine/threonine protein kinase [Acidobacteriota bacterium]
MGEVFRAVDQRLDRTVALKFLSDAFENDARARRQLAKEARAAAALDHPNICSVYGIEEYDGQHFIVMQHIAGRTLSEVIKERRLDPEEFRSLAKQIIEAVAFAHSHGIIHRDLKPGNIMISDDGRARILDFGLAKAVASNPLLENTGGETSQFSNNGGLIGTVSYMSPEQLRGEKLDFRSDVFSLGIVLFEMLTGKNPFARPTQAETIAAILGGSSSVAGTLDENDLKNLLLKCLSAELSGERNLWLRF